MVRDVDLPFPVDASPDSAVYHLLPGEKCVATSDSVLLDKCVSWCNLVGRIASSLPSAWVVPFVPSCLLLCWKHVDLLHHGSFPGRGSHKEKGR